MGKTNMRGTFTAANEYTTTHAYNAVLDTHLGVPVPKRQQILHIQL